jgi:NhaP-type Na+/H+ or K+/H+ antiporter
LELFIIRSFSTQAFNRLRVKFPFVGEVQELAVTLILGAHLDITYTAWKLMKLSRFLVVLGNFFVARLATCWVQKYSNMTRENISWWSWFERGLVNLFHLLLVGEALDEMSPASQLRPRIENKLDAGTFTIHFTLGLW